MGRWVRLAVACVLTVWLFVGLSALVDRYFIHEDWREVIFDAMGCAAIGMTLAVFLVAILAGRDSGPRDTGPKG